MDLVMSGNIRKTLHIREIQLIQGMRFVAVLTLTATCSFTEQFKKTVLGASRKRKNISSLPKSGAPVRATKRNLIAYWPSYGQ